ncbi:hypothetical protein [Vibrio cincinnatiensis]|uniref:hypothetical protein n=1 Tax=Vibrio cincinnatiensis TaxID=675 RepID=UPI001EDD67FD|nr:hypothetical protein [Vibrio cincinnatiensis]MCG3734480.1 hypothetical protein [Vibrio cincinnatiensis]
MKLDSLPLQFKPFKELEIAKNKLIDGIALITVNEFIPFLIGSNEQPEVWINIPSDPKGEQWQPLVRKNRSLHNAVIVSATDSMVTVNTPDGIVLEVARKSKNAAEITKLDLRPFGINVFLKGEALSVMNNSLSGNSIIGAKVMIGIGA